MPKVTLGALCWNQYTDWPSFLEAGIRAERLGYDSLWTWDHLYPIVGSSEGPMFEGWLTLAAWAQQTQRVRLGLMVAANTFRNPAVLVKMASTLDHQSGGRLTLGVGAAWFETEHRAFGLEYGDGPPDRLRWLGEALPVIRGMLRGEQPSAAGPHYAMRDVRNDPPPLQTHMPLLIGGGGEKVTLKLVAKYGDGCNIGGGAATVTKKEAILRAHCEAQGRDHTEIERTTNIGVVVIRDTEKAAVGVQHGIFRRNGNAPRWHNQPVGTPEQVADKLAPLVELGYHHLVAGFPAPYDEESMTRFTAEVRPLLEKVGS